MYRIFIVFIYALFGSLMSAQSPAIELRGAWVASVANIDWPTSSSLSAREQKAEIISVLDFYQSHHFNAIFVQVRPSADTFYPSKLEPWSKYLTGKQGEKPGYNPLKFWIKEAHKRGIEFHAWINPYRITNSVNDELVSSHPAHLHPDWVVEYGGKKYYNPGVTACKEHIKNIVAEIVAKYDLDGIHFDDYFYPYPIRGEEFPDTLSFLPFKNTFSHIDDWRRENVNSTIRELNATIKQINPHVKFGISPFGVWRNGSDDERGSDTKAGITNYDHLYADVLKWLESGWIDYVTPQLYWSTDNQAVPFEHLTQWWSAHSYGRGVYIGHALYKINSGKTEWKDPQQMVSQINISRSSANVSGSVFFSYKHFKKNELGITDSLKIRMYKYPSLIPSMSWLDDEIPAAPTSLKIKKNKLFWKCKSSENNVKRSKFAVYMIHKGGLKQLVLLTKNRNCSMVDMINDEKDVLGFQVTSISKTNNESKGSDIVFIKIE